MKKLKYLVRSYFGFSRSETNGFFILILLAGALLVAPLFYDRLFKEPAQMADQRMLDSLAMLFEQKNVHSAAPSLIKAQEAEPQQYRLFKFNPNNADLNTLLQLGIPLPISKRIIKYREAGGAFKIKSDLLKIYNFPESTYQKLFAFIDLPEERPLIKKDSRLSPKDKVQKQQKVVHDLININAADTIQLKSIRGIGPVLSLRMLKYRNALGGFISSEQFEEVYGLSPEVLETLKKRTYISSDFSPRKININNEGIQNIAKHPYINLAKAKVIYSFRQQHGDFANVNDLKKIKIITDDDILKLEPYIEF